MDEEKVNPLTTHLLQLVQGRQQAEIAKLTIMTQIAASLERVAEHTDKIETKLTELLERTKG